MPGILLGEAGKRLFGRNFEIKRYGKEKLLQQVWVQLTCKLSSRGSNCEDIEFEHLYDDNVRARKGRRNAETYHNMYHVIGSLHVAEDSSGFHLHAISGLVSAKSEACDPPLDHLNKFASFNLAGESLVPPEETDPANILVGKFINTIAWLWSGNCMKTGYLGNSIVSFRPEVRPKTLKRDIFSVLKTIEAEARQRTGFNF